MSLRRLIKTPRKGGQGDLPRGSLPLLGRVGITLIYAAEINLLTGKKEFQQSIKIELFSS
jgi:hypothetical protein